VSADGRRLAFATTHVNVDLELRDLAANRIVHYGSALDDVQPTFAPDGRTLYFISNRQGKYDLWAQPLSGIEPVGPAQRLTDERGTVFTPNAAPNGRLVAFAGAAPNRSPQISAIPTSGGPKIALSDPAWLATAPVWSPGGERIAFVGRQGGVDHIWWMRPAVDTRSAATWQITSGSGREESPAWSPDGTEIAYVALEGTTGEVWAAKADGPRFPRRITTGADAVNVRWAATGRLFVCGFWGSGALGIRSMTPDGQTITRVADLAGRSPDNFIFDVSRDGRTLVLTAEERRGNVSLLEGSARIY
jgi:TolB protein